MIKVLRLSLALLLAVIDPVLATTDYGVSLNILNIRLGVPSIVHGPGYDLGDGPATFIQKVDGTFNVYGSNQVTWMANAPGMTVGYTGPGGATGANSATIAATGPTTIKSNLTLAIGANQIAAIPPGVSTDACGNWITATYKSGPTWYALVHNEGPCNYSVGSQTNKSMAVFQSMNEGGTWTPVTAAGTNGTAISSLEGSIKNTLTGFGDCSWTPDTSGMWLYTYCGFYSGYAVSGYRMAILRVPTAHPTPGNFQVLYNGMWSSAALNDPFNATAHVPNADLIDWVGTFVSNVPGLFKVLAAGQDHVYNYASGETIQGITLAASNDYLHFNVLAEPLLNYDFQHFGGRPTADDLYLYPVLRNDDDGTPTLAPTHSAFWYTWVPPNNGLNSRYIVQQPVTMSIQSLPQVLTHVPNIGVALETWYKAGRSQYRSTTVNPFAGLASDGVTETGWAMSAFLGYVMTKCPGSETVNQCDAAGDLQAVRIEECWNASNNDYALHIDTNNAAGSCPSGVHVRTVGWLYRAPPKGFSTNAVYSCSIVAGPGYHFASSDPACNGQTQLGLLGYALAN